MFQIYLFVCAWCYFTCSSISCVSCEPYPTPPLTHIRPFVTITGLNSKQNLDWWFISINLFNFSTCLNPSSFSRTSTFNIKPYESSQFQLGLLQHFYLSNNDTMKQISRLTRLFQGFSIVVWNQSIDHFFQVFFSVPLPA